MTTNEKLRIIRSWYSELIIRNTPYGDLYGEFWSNGHVGYTPSYVLRDTVIDQAYQMIKENVWDEIR